jgi:hypothetical protein
VQGIQAALSGLERVTVSADDLLGKLGDEGTPCTVEQLRARFEEFVDGLTQGKTAAKVRIVITREQP